MQLLVLGANSDIAWAVACRFAKSERADTYLASRDTDLLGEKAAFLETEYDVKASAFAFNALDYDSHAVFWAELDPKPDVVVLAFGYLGEQQVAQTDFSEARKIIETNFVGAVSILEHVAAEFQARRSGTIIALGSLAGERGRESNYFYGAAKAGLAIYLGGLRNRLCKSNVRVITVLPGFVHTKMTKDLALPNLPIVPADRVADDIYKGFVNAKPIFYSPWYWRWIMLLSRNIPERIYMRMNL